MSAPVIREFPPSGVVEYFLDGAAQAGDLDGCVDAVLRLYGDDAAMNVVIEAARDAGYRRPGGTLDTCAIFADMAEEILRELPPARRGILVMEGVRYLPSRIVELAEVEAMWAIEDRIEGGCMEPFLYPRRGQHQRRYTKGLRRRLHAPGWIRRYVKEEPSSAQLRASVGRALARRAWVEPEHLRVGASEIMRDIQAQHERHRAAGYDRAEERLVHEAALLARLPAAAPLGPVLVRLKAGVRRQLRAERKRRRRVLRRAVGMASAVLGSESVSRLAAGRAVGIRGSSCDLMVQANGSLAAVGHGALDVSVMDADGATKLGRLCLYFQDTPAIDQVVALQLHFDAGLETEVLAKANLISVTPEGEQHPVFRDRVRERAALRPQEGPAVVGGGELIGGHWIAGYGNDYEARRTRNEAYWRETAPVWAEALGTFVAGRERSIVARAVDLSHRA